MTKTKQRIRLKSLQPNMEKDIEQHIRAILDKLLENWTDWDQYNQINSPMNSGLRLQLTYADHFSQETMSQASLTTTTDDLKQQSLEHLHQQTFWNGSIMCSQHTDIPSQGPRSVFIFGGGGCVFIVDTYLSLGIISKPSNILTLALYSQNAVCFKVKNKRRFGEENSREDRTLRY